MGSSHPTQIHHQKFIQMFNNNYELSARRQDQVFGMIQIYRNKSTKIQQIMLKTINYHEQNQLKYITDQMNHRITNPLPNLLVLYCLKINKQSKFCGSVYQVKIYTEYLEKNIKNQLGKRRKNLRYFNQQKLWKILISLTNAIKYLHENNIFHGQIRVENVLIDSDFHIKLVEKALLPKMNWQVQLQTQNIKLIKGKGVLFSPILLQCLYHKKTQLAEYNPFKADVYAVGMILLQCSSLKKAQDFYDYQNFSIKSKQIFTTLYELRKKYSIQFCNVIGKMLQDDDNLRLSAEQIYTKIRKIPNQKVKELNVSLNQSFLAESVRTIMM